MKGSSADPERVKVQIDLTSELEGSTEPKRGCSLDPAQKDNRSILKWLEKIEGTLSNLEAIQAVVCNIDSRLTFVTSILETFECVICRSLAKKPVMAPCCHRVVGCEECVLQCVRDNSTYQHCSSEATPLMFTVLKGFDHILSVSTVDTSPLAGCGRITQSGRVRETNSPMGVPVPTSFSSSDSDFEN